MFEVSKRALSKAQIDSSFELSGFERTHARSDLQPALAQIAVEQLHRFYPALFGTSPDESASDV